MPWVCSTYCFSAEGTDSESVLCGDADHCMFPDFEPDALLDFLEELLAEMGDSSTSQKRQPEEVGSVCVRHRESRDDDRECSLGRTVVGSPAANVDSIKEVIQADHHYHKEKPTVEPTFPLSSGSVSSRRPSASGHKCFTALLTRSSQGLDTALMLPSEEVSRDSQVHSVTCILTADCETGDVRSDLHCQPADLTKVGNSFTQHDADPAVVEHGERNHVQSEATTFLSKEMLESLEGLLTLDDFTNVVLAPSAECNTQIQHQDEAVCSVPGHSQDISESSGVFLDSDSCRLEKECDSGCPSPDSGFSESVDDVDSPLSEISTSPVSLTHEDMDIMAWQDTFIDVDLQLFPDVGI